jgi:hypothetical protein
VQVGSKAGQQIAAFVIVFGGSLGLSIGWRHLAPALGDHGIPPAAVALPLLALLIWFFLSLMKRGMLRSGSDSIELVPVNLEEFDWIQRAELDRVTAALEGLHFVRLQDYTIRAHGGKYPAGFARLFHSPGLHCYAELNQIRSLSIPTDVECTILSQLQDDWSISTTTRLPSPGTWTLRKPRSVWTAHPMMQPDQLLQAHLSWRENMVYYLGVQVEPETSFEAYEQRELETWKRNRQILRRKPMILIVLEQALFSMSPKMQWSGDYPKAAAKRSKALAQPPR